MPKGIMYVETRPKSPEDAAAYHDWYATHLKELMGVEGFVSARRFEPFKHDGPFVAIYEIDAPDLAEVQAKLREALSAGAVSSSPTVETDPPPVVRYFTEIAAITSA